MLRYAYSHPTGYSHCRIALHVRTIKIRTSYVIRTNCVSCIPLASCFVPTQCDILSFCSSIHRFSEDIIFISWMKRVFPASQFCLTMNLVKEILYLHCTWAVG